MYNTICAVLHSNTPCFSEKLNAADPLTVLLQQSDLFSYYHPIDNIVVCTLALFILHHYRNLLDRHIM